MNKEKTNDRIQWIDVAKGISVALVVLAHMIPNDSGVGQWIYSFHIPVFFIISGYLLGEKSDWKVQEYKLIIKKRCKSLLYPYLTFSTLSLCVILITQGTKEVVANIIKTLSFEGIATLWFLPALFIAELCFIFIKRSFNFKGIVICYCILFCLTTSFSLIDYTIMPTSMLKVILQSINILNRALIGSIYVLVGYIGHAVSKRISVKRNILCVLGLFSLGITVLLCKYNYVDLHYSIIGNPLIYYINGIFGSMFIVAVSQLLEGRLRIISFLGSNSIIVFATHLNMKITGIVRTLISFVYHNVLIEFVVVLMIEIVLIYIIKKYTNWLISYNEMKKRATIMF